MKISYELPDFEIYVFESDDVITASGDNFGDFSDLI